MPSIVTHYLFSEDALYHSKQKIQKEILSSHKLYNIFAQSFDNFFYYNFLSLKSGKEIQSFGIKAQRIKTNEYFKNIILTIKNQHQENNPDALAYLYGSLTHYVLDSNCHPFVIYNSGWLEEKNPDLTYRGKHEEMEVNIDAIYYKEKTNQNLYKESLANILLPKQKFSQELKNILDQTYKETFHMNNIGKIYEKSVNQGHTIIKYFVTDHYGMKKLAYTFFDSIFKKNPRKYQYLSFYIKNPKLSFLNRSHNQWCYPTDNNIKRIESFDDLYQKALQEVINLFELAHKVIHNQEDIKQLLNVLGDKSYVTGQNWQENYEMKYFDNQIKLKKNNLE